MEGPQIELQEELFYWLVVVETSTLERGDKGGILFHSAVDFQLPCKYGLVAVSEILGNTYTLKIINNN